MSRLTDAALRFRAQLLRQERDAASELVRAYAATWRRLRAQLTSKEAQITAATAQMAMPGFEGPAVPLQTWIYERNRIEALLRQVEAELRQFSQLAAEVTEAGQRMAVEAARNNAQTLMAESARAGGAPEIVGMFDRLPRSAVEDLIGFSSNGSPLRELFDALGAQISLGVRETLEVAVATGMNPRQAALMLRRQYGLGLHRALTIARTEQLRAYREASGRTYEMNADLLDGWVWLSAADDRTCASCLAMHGSVHPVERRIESHPNCRCVMVPRVRGYEPDIESGEEIFARMTPEQQDDKLGKAAGEAYRAGVVRLGDFVGVRDDPDWGVGRYVRGLRAVLGDKEAQKWFDQAAKRTERKTLDNRSTN